jgi:arginase
MVTTNRFRPGLGNTIGILGVPLGFGAGKVGSELGTEALRLTRFRGHLLLEHLENLGYSVRDYGNADVVVPNRKAGENENPRYLNELYQSSLSMIEKVREILNDSAIPVILGGDHAIAAGTLSGISAHFRDAGQEIGLIWFDAHADMNTPETSPSGNPHGMPLSTVLGEGEESMVELAGFSPKFNKEYVAHVGARDLDIGEKEMIYEKGMRDHFFTMSDIDRFGMGPCVKKAIEIASKAPGGYAVTFDVDAIDPSFAPGSGTLVRGGIDYREAHLALELIHEAGGMRSFEIVEVNPILDKGNVTTELACELILSAFGNVVL